MRCPELCWLRPRPRRKTGRPRPCAIIVPFGPGSTPDMVGAADRRPHAAEARPAVRDREPARRQRQYRDRCGGEGGAGRLHHRHQPRRPARHQHACCSPKCPTIRPRTSRSITMLATQPSALVVQREPGRQFGRRAGRAAARSNPGKYNFGSIGNGSLSHLAMEAIALKSGTHMVHIPYPGSPQAMTAVLRNDVQMACLPAISVTPHVASGQGENPGHFARPGALRCCPTSRRSRRAGIDVEADAWNGPDRTRQARPRR